MRDYFNKANTGTIAFYATFVLLFQILFSQVSQAAERPNVIVFLADDLGYGDLACYGHDTIKTPHLDKFAAQGIKLTQCYSASPVCSPSRSAIMTGRTPYRNGVYTWIQENSEVHLRTSEITYPRLLKDAGYSTCHVGKWHLNGKFNSPEQPQPGDHGYDHWMATQNNAAPSHKDPENFVRNGKPVGKLEGFSAPLVVDEAINWLKTGRDSNKPFLLSVWTHEPHLPIESDPQFMALYPKLDPQVQQHHGNVTQMDHAFGRLMNALDEMKLAENTVVIFTADNGPEGNGDNGRTRGSTGGLRGRKRSMHEGGIRVPGIVRWPGQIEAGRISDVPVIGSDIFPTILTLTHVEVPKDRTLDGVNILPLLTAKSDKVERNSPLFWRLDMAPPGEKLHMAMRQGDYKILANLDFTYIEVFNLKTDPKESQNLSSSEPKKTEELKAVLKSHLEQVEKEGPDWWKRLSQNGGGEIKKNKEIKKNNKK